MSKVIPFETITSLISEMGEGQRLKLKVNSNPYGVSLASVSDAMDFFAQIQAEQPHMLKLITGAELAPSVGDTSYVKVLAPLFR